MDPQWIGPAVIKRVADYDTYDVEHKGKLSRLHRDRLFLIPDAKLYQTLDGIYNRGESCKDLATSDGNPMPSDSTFDKVNCIV